MKPHIKHIALFLVLLLGLVYTIEYGIDTCYKKRVTNKFSLLLKHQVDPQIMIFGSSVVYHQFDPKIINQVSGYSAYNMGFPGMFFIQYNGLIKEYLSYEKQCKAIVIGCDFDNLGRNDLITRPDLFYAWLNNGNIYHSLQEIEHEKIFHARYLPGYKLTLLNKAFYTDMLLSKPLTDTMAGYEPINTTWEPTKANQPFNARYREDVYDQLKATVDEISSKGIKVIIIIPPVYEEGYKLIQNAELIKSKYRSLSNKQVYFLDYTGDSLCRSKENFHNFTHLNATGATVFSHTFAQDLLKIIHE